MAQQPHFPKNSHEPHQSSNKTTNEDSKMLSTSDSIASGMLFSAENVEKLLGLKDLFGGNIVHFSFDCPSNLRKAFVQECRSNGTSACKEEQKLMASYVVASRMKKHALGNTMSKLIDVPLVIEKMVFAQTSLVIIKQSTSSA